MGKNIIKVKRSTGDEISWKAVKVSQVMMAWTWRAAQNNEVVQGKINYQTTHHTLRHIPVYPARCMAVLFHMALCEDRFEVKIPLPITVSSFISLCGNYLPFLHFPPCEQLNNMNWKIKFHKNLSVWPAKQHSQQWQWQTTVHFKPPNTVGRGIYLHIL